MAQQDQDKTIYSLSDVCRSVGRVLHERYTSAFWVQAEMNKLNLYKHSGHCYPELVEKKDGKVVAQMKSTLWRADYERINKVFKDVLKEPLKDGIKILFQARIAFDAVHGLSLTIIDIDPNYTLGDLEREKQETIRQLKEAQVFAMNKSKRVPLLPKRIAIISVETSKGYADFLQVIDRNPFGYAFFHMMFPSLLQGDKAVESMLMQLNRIRKVQHHFDVVAIIRGGGGDVGLSCYNQFALAHAIATFPLPVLTGIGHATNETVCELVSNTNAITPTKLGEWLIQQFHNFSVPLEQAAEQIADKAVRIVEEEKTALDATSRYFLSVAHNAGAKHAHQLQLLGERTAKYAENFVLNQKHLLSAVIQSITTQNNQYITQQKHRLEIMENNLRLLDPMLLLRRGYSIVTHAGQVLTSARQIAPGEVISVQLAEGAIEAVTEKINI